MCKYIKTRSDSAILNNKETKQNKMNKYKIGFATVKEDSLYAKKGEVIKLLRSKDYNYNFNLTSGRFDRWGTTIDDDPEYSPFGPELWDAEITTKCKGNCPQCYKSLTTDGENMSFELFKTVFDKIPKTLTQVAFGADYDCSSNPDIWKMMSYCRENKVIPNITIADASEETLNNLIKYCGAVAVSMHHSKDICYNTIKNLVEKGLSQTNCHFILERSTLRQAYEMIDDMLIDSRLKDMNALVFLSLKKKGRGEIGHESLTQEEFSALMEYAIEKGIKFGMDSCSSHKYINFIDITTVLSKEEKKKHLQNVECCESFAVASMYTNIYGQYFPCSFSENCKGWENGIDLLKIDNFNKDVWNSDLMIKWRNKSLSCGRDCLFYKI